MIPRHWRQAPGREIPLLTRSRDGFAYTERFHPRGQSGGRHSEQSRGSRLSGHFPAGPLERAPDVVALEASKLLAGEHLRSAWLGGRERPRGAGLRQGAIEVEPVV